MNEKIDRLQLGELLESLHDKYNNTGFIEYDPVSIPHMFEGKDDREVGGFLTSVIAWGNRKALVNNARKMMSLMGWEPYRFCMEASAGELDDLRGFVHRTFNGADFVTYALCVRHIYSEHGGIGTFFENCWKETGDLRVGLSRFRSEFFVPDHQHRCEKHLSSIDKGAACKRMNMYLRWMVRRDSRGVDFGLWNIPASALYLPLDVHSGNMGRAFGLLSRRQNDWKAVEEITGSLRGFDPSDPVKYDFALFGAGIDGYLKK